MKKYTIQPGRHDFRPPEFPSIYCARRIKRLHWKFRFAADCMYHIPGEDQYDWNKGGGISFHLFRNNRDNMMWAWRWNPRKGMIDITAYSNNADMPNGRFIGWGNGQVMMTIYPEEVGEVIIEPYGIAGWNFTFRRSGKEISNHCVHGTRRNWRIAKRLGLWFGGNQPAPQQMTVHVDYRKR